MYMYMHANPTHDSSHMSTMTPPITPPMTPPPQRPLLERAVEEQPTEIFIKHEVPFNIDLVGSLLGNIRSNLIGQDFGESPSHPFPKKAMLPELQVSKLDDITSCLTVLSDYITSWSHDVAKNSRIMKQELRETKVGINQCTIIHDLFLIVTKF